MSIHSFGNNLKNIRKSKNLPLTEVAEGTGLSKQYLSRLENDLHTNPPYETVRKLADYFTVTPQYFFDSQASKNDLVLYKLQKNAPVIEWRQVQDFLAKGEKMEMQVKEYVAITAEIVGECFVLRIQNDAMQTKEQVTFNQGDYIVVEPCTDAPSGSFVVVSSPVDAEPILRKLVKEGGKTLLIPLNTPTYSTLVINDSSAMQIYGVVVERRILF